MILPSPRWTKACDKLVMFWRVWSSEYYRLALAGVLVRPSCNGPRLGRGLWRVLQPVHVWRPASNVCASAVDGHRLVIGLAGVALNVIVAVLLLFWVAYATAGEGDDWVTSGASIVAGAGLVELVGNVARVSVFRAFCNKAVGSPLRSGQARQVRRVPFALLAHWLNLCLRLRRIRTVQDIRGLVELDSWLTHLGVSRD